MNNRNWAAQAAVFFVLAIVTVETHAAVRIGAALPPSALSAGFTIVPSTSQEASDRGQTVGDAVDTATGVHHAVEWEGNTSSAVDLNPFGFTTSSAIGTDGTQQVGAGIADSGQNQHALLWYGTSASAVDLNPMGFTSSVASATNGTAEVGTGTKSDGSYRAILWHGTATSAIDINPAGFSDSMANGTNGKIQVGEGYGPATDGRQHALLWHRTAASVVDLNPTDLKGIHSSFALGIAGSQEVGYGVGPHHIHEALLWHGTAGSTISLNPADFTFSVANGTNGHEQVGEGYGPATDGQEHALLWSGDAKSYVDLDASLPAGYTKSFAFSINAAGEVFGYAQNADGAIDPIEWEAPAVGSGTPEPGGMVMLGCGCTAMLLRRKRSGNKPFIAGPKLR